MHTPCLNPLLKHKCMHLSFSALLSFGQTSLQVNESEVPSFTSVSASIELNKKLGPHKIEREKERE